MIRSRPLRFLALTLVFWVGARTAILWRSEAPALPARPAALPVPRLARADRPMPPVGVAITPTTTSGYAVGRERMRATSTGRRSATRGPPRPDRVPTLSAQPSPLIPTYLNGPGSNVDGPARAIPPFVTSAPASASARRWRIDAWSIVRGNGAASPLAPQLGGSQAGIRAVHRLGARDRSALFVRAGAPVGRGPAELAIGAQHRLATSPATIFVELRKLGDQAPAPGAGVFGGIVRPLPTRFRLEGYGQAGYVGGSARTGYADGQLHLTHPVLTPRRVELAAGGGIWGAAQRGAARLDVGPSLSLRVPIARGAVRAQIDWRFRLAGAARPASGPALTLATGF